jgi:heme/copper-type cytochrome/quinol oxidase subunit 3
MSDVALTASIELPAGSLDRRGVGWWGLVCAIAGEAALFGYLLFAYYYCRVEIGPDWIPGPLPAFRLALPNTIILLASSATIWFAEQRVRRGQRSTALAAMLVTLGLGIVFVAVQVLEWRSKTFSIRTNSYGSLYYTITGFHMAHVLAGLVAIALAAIWCARRYYDERRHLPMLIVSAYWHFVDVVWLAVFFTFYVSPRLWS